tara:strand:+ start:2245 stop:2475 length:231 start_codon:yes stop_codon:yes gene_type:complete
MSKARTLADLLAASGPSGADGEDGEDGAAQNLSLLAAAPAHYYEIESSVTTIADIEGSATLTGYNFVSGDLVTDAP